MNERVAGTEYLASCFISYSHADKPVAQSLAQGLRERGYYVWIDEGELRVGDSIIEAVGQAIDRVDFLVALVSAASLSSNWCQKEISLGMTGELNRRGITVLPCRLGDIAMPPSLADKFRVDISSSATASAVDRLHQSMQLHLSPPDPMPPRKRAPQASSSRLRGAHPDDATDAPIRMTGVDLNGITTPRNDGTRGSALYAVPILLSRVPSPSWTESFVRHWDRPSSWSTMHRPGIASVRGNTIVLDGTTMDEVESVHMPTLKLAVDSANADFENLRRREAAQSEADERANQIQAASNAEIANRLRFE